MLLLMYLGSSSLSNCMHFSDSPSIRNYYIHSQALIDKSKAGRINDIEDIIAHVFFEQ